MPNAVNLDKPIVILPQLKSSGIHVSTMVLYFKPE